MAGEGSYARAWKAATEMAAPRKRPSGALDDEIAGKAKRKTTRTKQQTTTRKVKKTEAAPCGTKRSPVEGTRPESQLDLVRTLIRKFSEQLTREDGAKGSLGDLLKLMQLEKELAPREEARELVVKWVAPWGKTTEEEEESSRTESECSTTSPTSP